MTYITVIIGLLIIVAIVMIAYLLQKIEEFKEVVDCLTKELNRVKDKNAALSERQLKLDQAIGIVYRDLTKMSNDYTTIKRLVFKNVEGKHSKNVEM